MLTALTEPIFDYAIEDTAPQPVNDSKMSQLAELAKKQVELEESKETAEAAVKLCESNLSAIRDKLLPDLLEELGLESFKTRDGLKISVKKMITASAGGKKDPQRFQKVCQWLKEHGHGGLVKRTIGVFFGVGEEEQATKFTEAIDGIVAEIGKVVMDDSEIHAMTLSSFVREQLEAGEEIPEFFNVHRMKTAVIDKPKF